MSYTQIRWILSGLPSGLGYTTFRWDGSLDGASASTAAANSRSFLNGFVASLPIGAIYTCDSAATTHEVFGDLIGDVPLNTVPSPITASGSGPFAGGAGLSVAWNTGSVIAGKRVRGRTYIAPIVTSKYDTGGTLSNTDLATWRSAATAFATSTPTPAVWSRRPGGVFGVSPITSASIADKVALIKSRRD